MRVYLAGPMTGYPDFNYPAFNTAAAMLRRRGWEVENPAENPTPECGTWQAYMRQAIPQMLRCDRVAMLPGWERSKGARIEFNLAVELEMFPIRFFELLQEVPLP